MKLQTKLANSVKKYIKYRSPERMILNKTLTELALNLPETAIFGGMLREFSLGRARNFSSDIDLVSLASSKEIFNAIKHFKPSRNKFGGYRFYFEKQLYDIWAFEDTWAFREGLVKGQSFSDLFSTTFFNLDAALYLLSKNECLISNEYDNWIKNSVLEINLKENPNPVAMCKRALDLAINKNLAIGPKLAAFLIDHVANTNNLLVELFMKDLNKHVNLRPKETYVFQPQNYLL